MIDQGLAVDLGSSRLPDRAANKSFGIDLGS